MDEEKIKDLFDTKERQAEGALALRGLLNDPGWRLLVKIVRQNIMVIRKNLEEGEEEETLEEVKYKRKLLKAHKDFIETPQRMIKDFTAEEGVDMLDELDPYEKREGAVKSRRRG